jgi:hypothetical protein
VDGGVVTGEEATHLVDQPRRRAHVLVLVPLVTRHEC